MYQSQNGFFLTNPRSQQSRPISQAGSQIIQSVPQIVKFHGSLQPLQLNMKIDQPQFLQNELQKLQEEQEDYDKINELELKLMDLRFQSRHEQSDIESIRSATKLAQFVGEAEIKQLEAISKHSLDFLKQKTQRIIGEGQGWDQYIEKQITIMKKENEAVRIHFLKLLQRIQGLEFELGVDEPQ